MPTPRLSNVILRVADLDRALAFWRDRVGLPVRGAGGPFAFLDAGGVAIALNTVPPPAEAGGGLAALTELVLEVADVRAAHAEMSARGVPFRAAPRAVTGDGTRELWAADFRDPDGHLVSVTGWVAKGGGAAVRRAAPTRAGGASRATRRRRSATRSRRPPRSRR